MTKLIFSLPIEHNRDLLFARQKARRLSHLMHFGPHEEACIVAGTFAVGLQAHQYHPRFDLCFAVEGRQLVISARCPKSENPTCPTIADGEAHLIKLSKTIPEQAHPLAPEDLAWMMGQVEQQAQPRLFEEVVRQNQEILMLLHELQVVQGKGGTSEPGWQNPTAA